MNTSTGGNHCQELSPWLMTTAKTPRGSKIILTIKSDNVEFLEERKLKDLVKKHSSSTFPHLLQIEKTTEKEIYTDEVYSMKRRMRKRNDDDVEIKEDDNKEKKKKTIKEVSN